VQDLEVVGVSGFSDVNHPRIVFRSVLAPATGSWEVESDDIGGPLGLSESLVSLLGTFRAFQRFSISFNIDSILEKGNWLFLPLTSFFSFLSSRLNKFPLALAQA
jgi:hypothetical protein